MRTAEATQQETVQLKLVRKHRLFKLNYGSQTIGRVVLPLVLKIVFPVVSLSSMKRGSKVSQHQPLSAAVLLYDSAHRPLPESLQACLRGPTSKTASRQSGPFWTSLFGIMCASPLKRMPKRSLTRSHKETKVDIGVYFVSFFGWGGGEKVGRPISQPTSYQKQG